MKTLILFLAPLFCIISITAMATVPDPGFPPKGLLKGMVKDAGVEIPLEYVNVALYSQNDSSMVTGTITDSKGFFALEKIPYGKYYLTINFIGYEKQIVKNIELTADNYEIDLNEILLKEATEQIDEVEVVADRSYVEFKLDKKVINVSQHINAEGGNAIDVLQNVPSVIVDAEGNISIRGSENFQVLINGNPTPMSGTDALKQIPASTIENIEIITNPSAKYDPDGVGAIVNIILKKERFKGLSGLINLSAGTFDNYSGDCLVNYRNSYINLFSSVGYTRRSWFRDQAGFREMNSADTLYMIDFTNDRQRWQTTYNWRNGLDLTLNSYNTLSFVVGYGGWGYGRNYDANYTNNTLPGSDVFYEKAFDDYDINSDYLSSSVSYKHQFDEEGHEISTDFIATFSEMETVDNQKFYFTDSQFSTINTLPDERQSLSNDARNSLRVKADYVWPVNENNKLEAGYQWDYIDVDAEYLFENYDSEADEWIGDEGVSNSVYFEQVIHALYSTWSGQVSGFQYKIGLRGEYMQRLMDQKTLGKNFDYSHFQWFPTLHISRKLANEQEVQLSYSRRINRPHEWHLNPFPYYSDNYYISIGNPDLKPEYANSYELNYQKRINQSFISASLFYRDTKNVFERSMQLTDNQVVLLSYDNLNRNRSGGAELMGNIYLKKWWRINVSADGYYYKLTGQLSGTDKNSHTDFYWGGRLNNTFSLKTQTHIQLTAYYHGPTETLQGDISSYYGFDAAVKQQFLNRSLTVSLTARNILNTMKFDITHLGHNFYTESTFDLRWPVISLNLSYSINNYQRQKNAHTEPEMNFGGM